MHLGTKRIQPAHDVLDNPVLTRGVHPLENYEDGPLVDCVELFLQPHQTAQQPREPIFSLTLAPELPRVGRVVPMQLDLLSWPHPKTFGVHRTSGGLGLLALGSRLTGSRLLFSSLWANCTPQEHFGKRQLRTRGD